MKMAIAIVFVSDACAMSLLSPMQSATSSKVAPPLASIITEGAQQLVVPMLFAATFAVSPPCLAVGSPGAIAPVPFLLQQEAPLKQTRSVKKVKALEDSRLQECEDKGDKWEQCFFLGTGTNLDPTGTKFVKPRTTSTSKGVPTW